MNIDLLKVLVIEDSAAISLFVQQVLEGGGFAVETVNSGLRGLERSKKAVFDLIIVDFHMPDMNGDRVTKTIRARADGKHIPILIMTTNTDPDIKAKFKQIGASGWLEKPLDSTRILTAVKHTLNKNKP